MEKQRPEELIMRFGTLKSEQNDKERFFQEIIDNVLESYADGLEKPELELEEIHPATLIAIISTNIIMNLFYNTAHAKDNKQRKEMLGTLLSGIVNLCMTSIDMLIEKDELPHH